MLTDDELKLLFLNSFHTEPSFWVGENLIVSGTRFNLIVVGRLVDERLRYEIVDFYIYEKYNKVILGKKVDAALEKTGALFAVVDSGSDNSDAIKGIQIYCCFHLVANLLDKIGSETFCHESEIAFSLASVKEVLIKMNDLKRSKVKNFCEELWNKIEQNSVFNASSNVKNKFRYKNRF